MMMNSYYYFSTQVHNHMDVSPLDMLSSFSIWS